MKIKKALTKKVGPFPRWVWGAALLIGVILYIRHKQNVAAQQQAAQDQSLDPYASYNQQANLDSGMGEYPDAYGGSYPLGGGGAGFGSYWQNPATPPPAGGKETIVVNVTGGGSSGGKGGKKGHHHKRNTKTKSSNPKTPINDLGGGWGNRRGANKTPPGSYKTHTAHHSGWGIGGNTPPGWFKGNSGPGERGLNTHILTPGRLNAPSSVHTISKLSRGGPPVGQHPQTVGARGRESFKR